MFKKMLTIDAGTIVHFSLVVMASCFHNIVFGHALNRDGQSGTDVEPSPHNRSDAPMTPYVHGVQNRSREHIC